MINLNQFVEILEKNPSFLASVGDNNQANLAVVADVKVISDNELLIAHNEMIKTITNVKKYPKVCLACFNQDWEGVRLYGQASYFDKGPYFKQVLSLFANENTHPKGAILVKVDGLNLMK